MNYAFLMPQEPTDEEMAEREADLAAVNNFMDGLGEHELYALSVMLGSMMNENGAIRATHFHGQVTALKRTKFGLCYCGSFHKATEHGATTAKKTSASPAPESEEISQEHLMEMYRVRLCNTGLDFHCKTDRCSETWATLDERMLYNKCKGCGAGPEMNNG